MTEDAQSLNDPSVLPPNAYRRNHGNYELVGYVNCLIGCRISGNAEGAALFEERIERFMTDHPRTPDVAGYYDAVATISSRDADGITATIIVVSMRHAILLPRRIRGV